MLVCMPWAQNGVAGAKPAPCDVCGQSCALAPSSQRLLAKQPMRIVCKTCWKDQLKPGEEVEIHLAGSPSEVAAEILGGLGKNN